jgi:hypothetical protein
MQTEVFVRVFRINGVAQIMCVRLSRLPSVVAPCGSSFRLTLPRLFWYPNRILRYSRRFKSTTWNDLVPSKYVLDAPDEHGFQLYAHIRSLANGCRSMCVAF